MEPRLTLLRPTDFARTPWKNGLGWTDQIAIHPPNASLKAGDFAWRISTAHIAQSAPFSVFPEHDRVLVVLEGAGVKLSHEFVEGEEPEIVELPPLEAYEFPGDVPTRCTLAGGPIQDFSVFLRKGEVSVMPQTARITADDPFHWEPQGKTNFLFAARGKVRCAGKSLEQGSVLRLDLAEGPGDSPLTIESEGSQAQVVLIEIVF